MDVEPKEDDLTGDLRSYKAKSLSGSLVFIIVILSLIFGGLGGAGTVLYMNRHANSLTGGEEKVVLTEDSAIIDVVKKASPAVVSVVVSKDLNKIPGFGTNGDPFFQFFGQSAPQSNTPNIQQVAAGTGFFISGDGTILTNKHVVSDETASYTVVTNEGKTYDAKVLSRDPVNDLAILKIDIQNAPILQMADSSKLEVGQRVIAIGNSLGQYQNTVTTGIVSGIGRSVVAGGDGTSEQLEGVIQTDAAINPGNSGGPLLNTLSQVIGINTAVDLQGQSVGFALPANDAAKALDSFKKYGRITRPFLGVRYVIINKALAESQKLPRDYGALILRGQNPGDPAVLPGSPADKAGLQENDIILQVNGTRVDDSNSLLKLLNNYQIGDTITLKAYHKGSEKDVKVTLGENK